MIYQFTHDSIFLGEDGPTHQPVEHYAALRAMPNLHVIRPADNNEVKMAWIAALSHHGPTALILSRQALRELSETHVSYNQGLGRGAYIIKREKKKPDYNTCDHNYVTLGSPAISLSGAVLRRLPLIEARYLKSGSKKTTKTRGFPSPT